MNRDMRDYMDRRDMGNYDYDIEDRYPDRMDHMMDERNPYGPRGGYVTSHRDHNMYDHMNPHYYDRGYHDEMMDGRRGRGGRRDRGYEDFGGGILSKKELRHWQNELCEHMDQHECQMFEFEAIIQQAKQMQIHFDRYSEEELYTAVLIMFTDYHKTIGQNVPMYIALAKDFLEDPDARVKYGEKLACYHDHIADV